MTVETFVFNDGGRAAAGYRGFTGDCVVRSVAIVSGRPYQEVYDALSEGCRGQRVTRRSRRKASARDGVHTRRKWFKTYMASIGFEWVATMQLGEGCTTHLRAEELPGGRIIARVSRHYTAVIDGVVHDTHDPSRGGQRCVYGYWRPKP